MDNRYRLSATGLILIALAEGFSHSSYLDSGGTETNGFGNTNNVTKFVSVPNALQQLQINTRVAEKAVSHCITAQMTQNQFDAFVDFTFNEGSGRFCNADFVKRFNAGDPKACDGLMNYTKVNGQVSKGLTERRQKERQLCLQP